MTDEPLFVGDYVDVRVVLVDPRLQPLPKTMLVRLPKTVADALTPGCTIRLATDVDVAIESFEKFPIIVDSYYESRGPCE